MATTGGRAACAKVQGSAGSKGRQCFHGEGEGKERGIVRMNRNREGRGCGPEGSMARLSGKGHGGVVGGRVECMQHVMSV